MFNDHSIKLDYAHFKQGCKKHSFPKLGMEFDPLKGPLHLRTALESLSFQPFIKKYLCLWNRKSTAEFVLHGQALNTLYGFLTGRGGEGDGNGDGRDGRDDV